MNITQEQTPVLQAPKKKSKKPGKSGFRKLIGWLHLWLGLGSGIVVLIVSLTGCIFVFQQEISSLVHHELLFVDPPAAGGLSGGTSTAPPAKRADDPAGTRAANAGDSGAIAPPAAGLSPTLSVAALLTTAQAALGEAHPIEYITTYKDPRRSWEFMAYKSNDTALTYFGAIEYYRSVFLNPYTGKVLGIRDYKTDFFSIIKYLHWSLLLNTPYGQPIVGWSTLIFVLLLITGLVLWWPAKWNKASRRMSFGIRWKASPKRLNYDLHNVPGFYTLFPALVLGLTGMVWAFRWFMAVVYVAAAGTTEQPRRVVMKSGADSVQVAGSDKGKRDAGSDSGAIRATRQVSLKDSLLTGRQDIRQGSGEQAPAALDIAYAHALKAIPGAKRMGISPAEGKEGVIYIYGYKDRETYYDKDDLQFDRYTGKLLYRQNEEQHNRGERLIGMNYDIHVGAIWGLPGKILAFLISLVCASLPVTGFLVWWGKRKKKPGRHLSPDNRDPASRPIAEKAVH